MILPPGFELIALEETASTNDDAKRLAAEGKPHGTVIWAKNQTAGRGRQGNEWESSDGNLFMSLILRPDIPLSMAGHLAFITGVAVAEALEAYGVAPALKWPNDILLNGKKLGGTLIESEIQGDALDWVVIGIGVNVNSAPLGTSISLSDVIPAEAGIRPDPGLRRGDIELEAILRSILESLAKYLTIWAQDGFAPVRKEWLRRVHGMGEPMTARLAHETLEGIFSGLDDSGALLLDIGGGDVVRITAGEVFFG